jgi:hypothetical protein
VATIQPDVDRLCSYFGCKIEQLVEHIPELPHSSTEGKKLISPDYAVAWASWKVFTFEPTAAISAKPQGLN